MIKAIIFDMDGTLVNTEPLFTKVWDTAAARRDKEYTLEMKKSLMGKADLLGAMEYVIAEWEINEDPHDLLKELNGLYIDMLPEAIEPMEGLFELLDLLDDMKIRRAISTSSPRPWAEHVIRKIEIHNRIDHMTTSNEVKVGKPHPEAYEIPIRHLGAQPHDAIAIEDSPAGVTSAKAAGLKTIAIKSPYIDRHEVDHADHHIDGLYEIDRKFLENLFEN